MCLITQLYQLETAGSETIKTVKMIMMIMMKKNVLIALFSNEQIFISFGVQPYVFIKPICISLSVQLPTINLSTFSKGEYPVCLH